MRRIRSIKSVRPMLLIRKDGNELYIESTASPIRDGTGNVTGGVLVFHDVSESRELNRRLSYHASHDVLTGLVNRREFETRLERALKSAKRPRDLLRALLHRPRPVQDRERHLRPQRGRCAARPGRRAAEVEGPLARHARAPRRRRVRRAARELLARGGPAHGGVAARGDPELPLHLGRPQFPARLLASASCRSPPENEDVASVLSAADCACGAAKESGRNRVHCFEENDIDLMRRRREMQWAARINNALEESRFELFRMTILPLQKRRRGRALRAAAAHAGRERQDRGARPVHRRGRALRHHAVHRPLGDRQRLPLAGVGGRRARAAGDVLDQPRQARASATTSSCRT